MSTTTNDPTIVTDRYTSPARPPQVLSNHGDGWSATPHGAYLDDEPDFSADKNFHQAGNHLVRLESRGTNTRTRLFTVQGAHELGTQLITAAGTVDRAHAEDNRPANSDMVSGPMAGSMSRWEGVEPGSLLERELNATLSQTPEGFSFASDEKTASLVLGTDEAPPPNDRPITVAEHATTFQAQVRTEDGELVFQFHVRRDMLTSYSSIVNEAERLLVHGEHPVAPGIYVLTFPPAAGPGLAPHRIDLRPVEDYRTAGSSPSFSWKHEDDAVPPLATLIVLAESFLTRPGHSGSISLAREEGTGGWVASITYDREGGEGGEGGHGLGTSETTAADALRTALNEVGEQV